MIKTKIGFIVYGVHKDGLKDPMGDFFVDSKIVSEAKKALKSSGLDLMIAYVRDLLRMKFSPPSLPFPRVVVGRTISFS